MLLLDLQKTLGQLAMPAGLVWLLLLAAAGLLLRRRHWAPAALVLLAWGLYTAAGDFYLGTALLAGLERTIAPVDFATVEPFDAVCVLGGGTDLDPWGRPILATSGDRVLTAARLWRAGKARTLVASGAALDTAGVVRDAGQETRTIWRELGVPDSAIVVVAEPCWITRDEIAALRALQLRLGWERVALVSSAFHLPRALALADRVGLRCTPVGADWRGRAQPLLLNRLVPHGNGFELTAMACKEYLGRRVGR